LLLVRAPRFAAYGVDLWLPELGGKFDSRNPSHKMLMSVLGGMSESERQHVQARVRAAMDTQVVNEGRHQGGRTPYGYEVVDGGPHPNPRKAAEGHRLRVLAVDEKAAEAVRRIFAEKLAGAGDRAIACGLNRDGVPCPSMRRPLQNRHRLADGWQASTVRAVLENPRYTGYAFFGRWTRREVLLDPDDVAAGHVIRFRRVGPGQVVRSRKPAHPAIVSIDDFTRAQLLRRTRSAGGMAGIAKLERENPAPVKRDYLLRGRVRCALCERKMQGGIIRSTAYYRCRARTLAPGSAALAAHPCTVNLREDVVAARINEWIGSLFAPQSRDATVRALVASQVDPRAMARGDAARQQLGEAEATLRRFQEAIAAGVDPAAVVDPINRARAERDAARASLAHPEQQPALYTETQIRAMVDELGDVGAAIGGARPGRLAQLYRELDIGVRYEPLEFGGSATVTMRVANECVRGGTCALTTRLFCR
jgi:hypothetical protein